MILLPQTSGSNAMLAAEKIRMAVEQHSFKLTSITPPINIKVTISLGLSAFDAQTNSAVSMIRGCNTQLARAK
jgi:PleD family two-component response regulator